MFQNFSFKNSYTYIQNNIENNESKDKYNLEDDNINKEIDLKNNCVFEINNNSNKRNDESNNKKDITKNKEKYIWNIINEINIKRKYDLFIHKKKNITKELNYLHVMNIDKNEIEIGSLGYWKLSSYKNKDGLKKLRDNNINTYWQTKGICPHTLTIEFLKLVEVTKIYLLFNYMLDESYTPYEIVINIGNDENHLEYLCRCFCNINKNNIDKTFWFIINLKNIDPMYYMYNIKNVNKKNINIYCRCLQIEIISNQHNGKDSRIRQVKIFGKKM